MSELEQANSALADALEALMQAHIELAAGQVDNARKIILAALRPKHSNETPQPR